MRFLIIILSLTFFVTPILSFKGGDPNIEQQLIIFRYNPVYPVNIYNENRYDTLKVKAEIDKNGIVVNVQILESTGDSILDSIAIKTAYKYRYMPFYSEGKPISC